MSKNFCIHPCILVYILVLYIQQEICTLGCPEERYFCNFERGSMLLLRGKTTDNEKNNLKYIKNGIQFSTSD